MSNLENEFEKFNIILEKYERLNKQINTIKNLIKQKKQEVENTIKKYSVAVKNAQVTLSNYDRIIMNYMKHKNIYKIGLPNGDVLEYKKYTSKRKMTQKRMYTSIFEYYKQDEHFVNFVNELKSKKIEVEIEKIKVKEKNSK